MNAKTAAKTAAGCAASLAPVKCLIVDDLEENLLALAALLRRDGVEVLQARSGIEALELLLVHDVALAFLDVQMPLMDGFELAELMRGSARTRDVPLIFVTAGAQDQRRIFKGYESGAVDFLFKPIEPHVLESKARVFFQLHRQKLQLAHELRERTETLRLQEIFTAVLGHDLRTPLGTMMMSAQIVAHRAQDDDMRRVAARMLSNGQFMGRMIGDLLDLSRARLGGGIAIDRRRVDLGALVQRVVQERREAEPARPIDLRIVGDADSLVGQAWDADRLTQVVANLIDNALHHGDPGQPVDVCLDGRGARDVELVVANEGVVPAELRASIFEPFRGKPREGRPAEGLGLGLYIVHQIVEALGGRIELDTGTAGRTVFRVSLPRDGGGPTSWRFTTA